MHINCKKKYWTNFEKPVTFEKTMKLWLDDIRSAPENWVHVYWPTEVIEFLQTVNVTHISLDHDLGNDERGTGYDVLLWIEKKIATEKWQPPIITVHSANPVAIIKMNQAIKSIERLWKQWTQNGS